MQDLEKILGVSYSNFKDNRDGRIYKTITLNGYEWFLENLDFDLSKLYGGKKAAELFGIPDPSMDFNLEDGGRHYRFLQAQEACPEGFEIPKRNVFVDLFTKIAGKPPHLIKNEDRFKISSFLYGKNSLLKLNDTGRFDKSPLIWASNKMDYLDEGLGWYWTSTPGALTNGGSAFGFTRETYVEDVVYGFCAVRPVRKIYTVMEIKKFDKFLNEMEKSYGQDYSLRDVKRGQIVAFRGSRYFVIDSNEVVLELSKDRDAMPGDRNNVLANRSMFREYGAIPDQN